MLSPALSACAVPPRRVFASAPRARRPIQLCATVKRGSTAPSFNDAFTDLKTATASVAAAALLFAGAADAISFKDLQRLSYNEVRGSGLAAVCPTLEEGSTDLKAIKPGRYTLQNMCLEPTKITVKEEGLLKGSGPQWSDTTLLTRQTTNLSEISAQLTVDGSGNVRFKEDDSYSLNLAPITVQLPGGERVPFIFTVKNLEANGSLNQFGGSFSVPMYRGSSFLDPKGRGGSTGYDTANGLYAHADIEELEKENLKKFTPGDGTAVFSVAKVDPDTGEVAGVFETVQPSDTDMGSKQPKEVKVQGLWYGQLG